MNRIYRLVYNHALGLMQVTSEIGASPSRGRSDARTAQRPLLLAPLAGALLLASSLQAGAQSLPQNGQIITGSASINSSGNVLNVSQSTQSALIQWQNFNIGAGNLVRFELPSPQAVSINQVTGGTASTIAGNMTSNGQVFLLNPSGIAFTGSAYVNVGGLLASTLNVGTPSLPVDGGPLPPMFQLAGGGTGAAISNDGGTLIASDGGISLVGGAVSNNGMISAANGSIDLVAAGGVLVTPEASSTGNLQLSFATTSASTAAATGVINTGTLSARNIGMNAMVGPGLASHGINTGGTIIANAIDPGDGVLTIRSNAAVQNSATITAAAADIAGSSIDIAGGSIYANGARLTANTGSVNVSGTVEADSIELTAATVSQGSSGSVQGAVRLDVQGTANLSGVDNRIGAIAGTVGGDLNLVTRSALSNNGALQVTGSTSLTAADSGVRKDITLGNTGNRFGGALFATGNDIVLDTSGTLTLGGIDARSLDANGAAITLNGTLLTSGDQLYRAPLLLTGDSSVTAANSHFAGSIDGAYRLSVTTSQATTFAGAVGSITPLQALSVVAGGGTLLAGNVRAANDIVFSGPLRLDADTSMTSTSGKVGLNGAVDSNGASRALTLSGLTGIALGGPLGATSTLKSLQATAGVIELGNNITSIGNIVLDGLVYLTGNARLHSSADAISSGAISSSVSANNPEGYDLGLNAHSALHVNGSIAARNIDIDAPLFNGLGVNSKGTLRINSVLPLIQGGAYLVDGTATFSSTGDIQLTNAGNHFGGVVSLDGVNARVNAGNLQLGNVSLDGTLWLELAGSLSQTVNAVLDVDGTTTLIAGDAITLNGNNNRFGSPVSVTGRQIQIQGNGLLAFSSISATSLQTSAARLHLPTTVSTLGLQRYNGAVTLLGDTHLRSDLGQIYFNGSIDGANALTIERALEVVFNSSIGSSTTLASLDTSGVANTHLGGDISSSGRIALGGLSLLSTRDYSIASSAGDVRIGGTINGTADGQSSLSLRAANALDLQGDAGTSSGARLNNLTLRGASIAAKALQTGGKLDIGSGAGFAQGGVLTVGGDAVFSAGNGGNLLLDDVGNSFAGKVALQGNQATIRTQSSLALDSINLNRLTAYGDGSMSLANATVLGNANLDADALLFNNASITGSLTATARTGTISQGSGALSTGSNSELSAGTDIVLGNDSNQFGSGLRASARDLSLTAGSALDIAQLQARDAHLTGDGILLGNTTIGRDLTMDSSGSIQQRAGMSVGGAADLRAAGDITLRHINNHFAGDVALQAAQASLYADQGLSLAQVNVDGLLATTLGRLSLRDAQVTDLADLDGASLALARADVGRLDAYAFAGGITQSDTVTLGDGSELSATGNVMLDRPDNHLGRGLQVRGADVVLSTLDVLDQADVQASGLARLSGEGLRLGTVSAGSLQVYSQGDIDQGVALQVTGDSIFSASGDIRLGHAANQLAGGVQLAGHDVRIENAGHLRLDGVAADGDFIAVANGGGIGQTASVGVGGRSDMTARDNITLQQAGNTFGGAVALDASAIRLAADSSLDVDGLRTRSNGTAQLEADGNLTLSGDAIDLAGGSLLANAIGGQLRTRTALTAAAVVLQGRDGVAVGADITGGQVILASDVGNVVQEAGRIQANKASALASNSGDIVVENADNRFNDTLLLIGEDIRVAAGDLQLAGVQASGDLSLTSSGNIVQSMQVVVDGTSRFAAGGDITLQHADNRLNGQVEIDGRDVQLYADAGLNLQAVNARNLDAHAGNTLVLDNATVSGDATVQGQELLFGNSRIGGNLVARSLGTIQQTAALRITGTSQLQAGGGIQLEQAGNHFGGRVDIDAASASITSADGMQLGNITTTGDLQVSADAGLRLDGQLRAANVDLATTGIFDNRAGSSAIALSGPGRWQVYLASPFQNHVFGGLDSGNTALWNTAAFANATGSANRYLFAWQPTLTVTANTLRKIYGDSLDPRNAVSITGAMAGVTGAYLADNVAELITGTPLLASTGASATAGVSAIPYALDISAGTLDTGASGYALSFVQGELWVDPRALTITAIDGWKMIGQSLTLHDYSVDGLKNDDTVDSVRLFSAGSMVSARPGRYEILVSDAIGAGLGNYDIRYQGGKLDVGGTSDQTAAHAAQLVAAGLPRLPTPLPAAVPSPLISVSDGGISQPAACTGAQRGSCLGMQPE